MADSVAFISGGGSGIGQATAVLLARQGTRVALATGRCPRPRLRREAENEPGSGQPASWAEGLAQTRVSRRSSRVSPP